MADVNVPISFEIYKGDQPGPRGGPRAGCDQDWEAGVFHLRLDDETVSRMHAVIEATSRRHPRRRPRSTRGTTVNGERITKARLQSGDEIMFGDCRVVVTFVAPTRRRRRRPRSRLGWRTAGQLRAAAASRPTRPRRAAVPPPPPGQHAASGRLPGPAAIQRLRTPRRRSRARRAPAPRSRSTTARARWRSRPSSAASSPAPATCSTPRASRPHGQGTTMMYAGLGVASLAVGTFVPRRSTSAPRRSATRPGRRPARTSKALHVEGPLAGVGGHRLRRPASPASRSSYMGLKRRGKTSPNFLIGSDGDVDAPVSPDFVPSVVAPAGRSDRRRLRRQRHPADDRRGLRRQPELLSCSSSSSSAGLSFSLPQGGSARLDCGETTFVVSATAAPAHARRAVPHLAWDEQVYTVGSAVALGLFLLMIFSVPPDPKSLSLDLFN